MMATGSARFLAVLVGVVVLTGAGCGSDPQPTAGAVASETGKITLALTSVTGTETYVLTNTTFLIAQIQPPADVALRLRAPDALVGDLVVPDLAPGRYQVGLAAGWQLQRQDGPTTLVPVKATLQSMNPVTVSVFSGQTASVTFQFQTTGLPITFGPGAVDIGVDVGTCDPAPPPGVELNVIANSDFETDTDGWTDGAVRALDLSTTAHCGLHSGQTTPFDMAPALTYDLPNFEITTTYVFSAWVRLVGSSAELVRFSTRYRGINAAGESDGCGFYKASVDVSMFAQVMPPNVWTRVEGSATVGGPGCLDGQLRIDSTRNSQFLLTDDVYAIPQ